MGRRKSTAAASGCMTLLGIALFVAFPPLGIVVAILWLLSRLKAKCEVCGAEIRKEPQVVSYQGRRMRVCPSCRQQLQRRISREAVAREFGK